MRFKTVGLAMAFVLAILLAPFAAEAQRPGEVYRIGILAGSSHDLREQHGNEAFQQGLRALGYVEGKNVILEYRYTEGNVALLPELAAELVRLKVDIIVASAAGYVGVLAAKQATTTIPIVMVGLATDPVETGLVESLAHPGGNITGLTLHCGPEKLANRLEPFQQSPVGAQRWADNRRDSRRGFWRFCRVLFLARDRQSAPGSCAQIAVPTEQGLVEGCGRQGS